MELGYLIALKFGTHRGGVRVHLGTKNMIHTCKAICDYSQKITIMLSRPQGTGAWGGGFRGVQEPLVKIRLQDPSTPFSTVCVEGQNE